MRREKDILRPIDTFVTFFTCLFVARKTVQSEELYEGLIYGWMFQLDRIKTAHDAVY